MAGWRNRLTDSSLPVAVVFALLLTGCGTRASDAEVTAGVVGAGGELTVSDETLAKLATLAAGRPAVTTHSDSATSLAPKRTPTRTSTKAPADVGTAPAGEPPVPSGETTRTSPCAAPGAPVAVGQVGNFSGLLGPVTSGARTALAVWARTVNARGGVACHPLQVYAVDDGGDPSRTSAAVGSLVARQKIVALVGTASILSLEGLIAGVEKAKIPVVGGDLASFVWNQNRWLFPQGSGLEAVLEERLRYAGANGTDRIGLLYCVEAHACTEVADAIPALAERTGTAIVSSAPVSLTQTDFTAQCQNARNAGATGLLVAVDGSSIGRIARSCAALRYHPQLIANGLVISAAQAADPNIRRNTLLTTSANAPWTETATPGQREFAQSLAAFAPGVQPDGLSIQAWTAGKLFEAAVARLTAPTEVDTAAVLTGLGRIRGETLGGLATSITFTAGQQAAPPARCAFVELLTETGWSAPVGSRPICGGAGRSS